MQNLQVVGGRGREGGQHMVVRDKYRIESKNRVVWLIVVGVSIGVSAIHIKRVMINSGTVTM